MTERVYYASDATEGRAQIIGCRAEADGRYAIELDRTLFHPQGGGQPSDSGWIDEQVVMTVATRGDSVLHIVEQPLPLGEVKIRIDASARQLHARLHSAGHLLGLAGEQLGWRPVKAHHWPRGADYVCCRRWRRITGSQRIADTGERVAAAGFTAPHHLR